MGHTFINKHVELYIHNETRLTYIGQAWIEGAARGVTFRHEGNRYEIKEIIHRRQYGPDSAEVTKKEGN